MSVSASVMPQGQREGCGQEAVSTGVQDDSQNESEEWEGEGGEWERGEGSGESENSVPVGQLHGEEGDGGSSSEEEEEEGEVSEREVSEEEEEEDVEEQKDTPSDPVAVEGNAITEGSGVRDISENERGTIHCEREPLHRRVGHLPLNHPHNHNPYVVKPTTTPVTPPSSSSGRRQWLLEVTLVLLVTTLLLTVCSRLSYDWVVRLCNIVSEKPI